MDLSCVSHCPNNREAGPPQGSPTSLPKFPLLLPSGKLEMKRTENASAAPLRRAMHEAAGAPPQRTNGGCAAAQSTGAAALRGILQARPLALQVHGEPAIVDKSTAWCAVDHHVGRALRRDNRGPRTLARTRARRASCRPGGGRPSSSPERGHAQGQP